MSVESKNSNIAQKPNGDKKGTGLTDRLAAAPKELRGIQNVLAQRRIMRDTTNHPSVELARTGRADAIQRRLKKSTATNRTSTKISDSGSPDDAGSSGIADSGVSGSPE
jgi:hypothetical protein